MTRIVENNSTCPWNIRYAISKICGVNNGDATCSPPAFMHRGAARRIDIGNIDDDLARAGEADWIVEAVVERLDVKRDLYARLDAVRRPGAIVSSNTSTIPLARLVEGASDGLQRDFAITAPGHRRILRGPAPGEDARAVPPAPARYRGSEGVDCTPADAGP